MLVHSAGLQLITRICIPSPYLKLDFINSQNAKGGAMRIFWSVVCLGILLKLTFYAIFIMGTTTDLNS